MPEVEGPGLAAAFLGAGLFAAGLFLGAVFLAVVAPAFFFIVMGRTLQQAPGGGQVEGRTIRTIPICFATHYRAVLALAASSRKRRSGVTGSSVISIPSGARASATALAMAAGAPMVPPSPTPLKPPRVDGDGCSRCITSTHGSSAAVGIR